MEKINLTQKANPREQVLALLALLAFMVLFFRVLYFPERDAKQTLESQTQNLILERDALRKFNEALQATVTQTSTKEGFRSTGKMQILEGRREPLAREVSNLLRILTSHEFVGGVTVKKMSDIPPTSDKGFKRTGFFIEMNGHFRDIVDYLNRVQQLAALTTIDQITLKMSEAKAARIDLELNGTLFQLEEPI